MGEKWSTFLERLPKVQMIVGLMAGTVSILGAVYSVVPPWRSTPRLGEVVTVVRESRSKKAITDATVEILTLKDALVTRLTSRAEGRARIPLREGDYRLRVSHPNLGRDIRAIHVLAGQTAEFHIALGPPPVATGPPSPASRSSSGNVVSRSVESVRRFFRDFAR
jgi:hypothetical protein